MSLMRAVEERAERQQFADKLARREREVVFVTGDAGGAEALRGWGLLAWARPRDWDGAMLNLLAGRDVVVVAHGPGAKRAQSERDAEALAGVARRVGVLVPRESPQHGPTRDLGEYVRRQRTLGLGAQVLVAEALGCLRGQTPREREDDAEAEWPPLRLGELPAVEPFPLDVLPEAVAEFVAAVARNSGAPVDAAALPALAAAGAAIGLSAALALRPGERVLGMLHVLNVGEPAAGGTCAMQRAIGALRALDGVAVGSEGHLLGKLYDHRRGLLVAREDATTWLSDLSAPRKREGDICADLWHHAVFGAPAGGREGPFLAFCGNVAPEALRRFGPGPGGNSGRSRLLDRLLVVLPDPVPHGQWSDEGIPVGSSAAWSAGLERLRERHAQEPPGFEARFDLVAFTDEAKAEWVAWYNARTDEWNVPGGDPAQRAAELPLREITARLALIVHLLHEAFDPARGPTDPLRPLGVESLRRALRLWSYFRAHQRRVRWVIAGGTREPVAGAIVDWIKRTGRTHFSVSELTDALRWLRTRPDEPATALGALEACHALRRRADAPRPPRSPGRTHSPIYDVHPGITLKKVEQIGAIDRPQGDSSDISEISEVLSDVSITGSA